MSPVKVALAGATGNIGQPIFDALLKANHQIVVLTRKGSTNTSKLPKSSNVTIKEVDYTSVDTLKAALEGVKVVVSTLATEVVSTQQPLIDASIAASVERFLPSEYGSDTFNEHTSKLPVFQGKVGTIKYLEEKAKQYPSFSYTAVITGPFFDWGMKMGFLLNPSARSGTIYNGGDVPFSTTTLAGVGQAVVGVIANLSSTANRPVYVRDVNVTQNQLLVYAKQKDSKEWDVTQKETQEIYEESMAVVKGEKEGNMEMAMLGFIVSSIFGGEKVGGVWEGRHDADLLGVKKLSEEEVKKTVWDLM